MSGYYTKFKIQFRPYLNQKLMKNLYGAEYQ